ncbi:MAG: glycosyltransferase family 39 protein [Patescibacteria group bacterium]
MLWKWLLRTGAVAILALFMFWSPGGDITSTPRFWRDEAIPFEIARGWAETGTLDVVVAPGVTNAFSYLTHATGFPVTFPLAVIFRMFGASLFIARIYMLVWVAAALISVFFVARSFFGRDEAFAAVMLVGTFSSFYANGRTVTGEIPGFLFLLWALFFIYKKEWLGWGGMWLGLAAVTKPSMYLLLLPAAALEIIITRRGLFLKDSLSLARGVVPVLLVWFYIIVPEFFQLSSWQGMIDLYRQPFNEASLLSQFPAGFLDFFFHSTILYFLVITGAVLYVLRHNIYDSKARRMVCFVLLYGICAFSYVLRSPGWFRFLVGYEALILIGIVPVLFLFAKKVRLPHASFVAVFVVLHTVNYFFLSNIPSGSTAIQAGQMVNTLLDARPDATIGFVRLPTVAPFVDSWHKYQFGDIGGHETYGIHPLAYVPEKFPTYLVSYANQYEGFEEALDRYYQPTDIKIFNNTTVYIHR